MRHAQAHSLCRSCSTLDRRCGLFDRREFYARVPGDDGRAVAEDAGLKKDSLAALQVLYAKEPKAKEIGDKSKAILVFPNLVKAGFITGVQGGDGVLIENGKITGVYNNTAVSYGTPASDFSVAWPEVTCAI